MKTSICLMNVTRNGRFHIKTNYCVGGKLLHYLIHTKLTYTIISLIWLCLETFFKIKLSKIFSQLYCVLKMYVNFIATISTSENLYRFSLVQRSSFCMCCLKRRRRRVLFQLRLVQVSTFLSDRIIHLRISWRYGKWMYVTFKMRRDRFLVHLFLVSTYSKGNISE